MLEDTFPAAKRIIAEISASFKRDPKLKSFEIILEPESQNKSPVRLVEHCLGLESWSVPHVFYYAYRNVTEISSKNFRLKFKDPEHLSNLLTTALLLNPEIVSFWNLRRQLVELGHLCPCDELHLTSVVLSFKPKCGDVFSYRRWILSKLFKEDPGNVSLIENEFQDVLRAAEKYACNYNAWNHCLWCIKQITDPNKLLNLLAQLDTWVSQHVSDHSALSFRQALIKHFNLLYVSAQVPPPLNAQYSTLASDSISCFLRDSEPSDSLNDKVVSSSSIFIPLGLVFHEFLLNSELILRYPGHESLWSHRRFILFYFCTFILNQPIKSEHSFSNFIHNWFSQDVIDVIRIKKDSKLLISAANYIDFLKSVVFSYEKKFLQSSASDNARYIQNYKVWVKKMLKIDFDQSENGTVSC